MMCTSSVMKYVKPNDEVTARKRQREQRTMRALGMPDFETAEDCTQRQARMLRSFKRMQESPDLIEGLSDCTPDICGMIQCREGCYHASRRCRIREVPSAVERFEQPPGPLFSVTVVHRDWSWPVDASFDPKKIEMAHQWLAKRLRRFKGRPIQVMGSWEFCLNVSLEGVRIWCGHLHFLVAGLSRGELDRALSIDPSESLTSYSRPVMIKPVRNLGRQMAYANKHYAEQRFSYIKEGVRETNKKPLSGPLQWYYDKSMIILPEGTRIIKINTK